MGRPERPGDGLPMPPGADAIISRQFSSDWDTEEEASFELELASPIPDGANQGLATEKSGTGGAQENINAWGHDDLPDDQALVVEVTPPEAQYWSLHAGTFWWESLDDANRHTSLNDHQAVIDDDGVFRAVVALHDPGVPNWIDTMGHTKGPLLFRWVVADHGPQATATVVPFADVRDRRPAGTPTVTPAERSAASASRRRAVQRRFAA